MTIRRCYSQDEVVLHCRQCTFVCKLSLKGMHGVLNSCFLHKDRPEAIKDVLLIKVVHALTGFGLDIQWNLTYPDTSVPRLNVWITEFPDK